MDHPLQFLIVDFHSESRFLLVRTLLRKFPGAQIHECDDADVAVDLAKQSPLAAIITHRTFETSGVDLVRRFRAARPDVPVIMVSGIDREQVAMDAGASSFLPYDEWLRIGSAVEGHLSQPAVTTEKAATDFPSSESHP